MNQQFSEFGQGMSVIPEKQEQMREMKTYDHATVCILMCIEALW